MNFCVKCGKETDETVNNLCIDCFLDGRKLTSLPHHVDVKVCANCGDVGYGEFWTTKDIHEAMEQAAESALIIAKGVKKKSAEVSLLEQDPQTFIATVDSLLDINGHEEKDSSSTIVRIKSTVCKRCSRQLGNYYESILQIRGSKDVPQKTIREAQRRVENLIDSQSLTNRNSFISKTEEVQGGIDLYISSISLAKAATKDLSDTYCAETKEASKLVGVDEEGQEMYRVTYLVRLPEFQAGDVILYDGRYFKLNKFSNNGAKVVDLMNHRERTVKRTDIPTFKVHARFGDLRETVVVSKRKGEIQVLDPSNYSTIDLAVPEDAEIGETVKVVEIDEALHYVP